MKEHEESKQQSYTDQTNDASLKSLEAVIECALLVSGSVSPYARRSQDRAGTGFDFRQRILGNLHHCFQAHFFCNIVFQRCPIYQNSV